MIVMRRHIWARGAIGGGWLDQTHPVGKSACSFLPTRPSARSPRHLEVGHGARLPQRRHTVHTGLFKHLLPDDFVCAGAVLLRGCVWLCKRGCSLALVSGCLQHWPLWQCSGSWMCPEFLRLMDSVAPWRVGSPRITESTRVSCIGWQILHHQGNPISGLFTKRYIPELIYQCSPD